MKNTKIRIFLGSAAIAAAFSVSAFANTANDVYNVQKGDTLWEISQKYNIKLDRIIEANPQLKNPNLIYPNDAVAIPLSGYEPHYNMADDIGASVNNDGNTISETKYNLQIGSKANVRSNTSENQFEHQVAELVNKERVNNGLKQLVFSPELSNIARVKSEDMMNNRYFGHTSPTYGSPFDMMKAFGITYRTAGENIAKGQQTPESVINAWMGSPSHRANILNPNFTEIGVGYVNGGSSDVYWTQQFIAR